MSSPSLDELLRAGGPLGLLLGQISDGVTVQAPDGRLAFANDAAAHMCGFASGDELVAASRDEVIARYRLFDEAGAPIAADALPSRVALATNRPADAVMRVRDLRTGEERWTTLTSTPLHHADGTRQGVINVLRDVTLRKRVENGWRFLAGASAALASSLEYEVTLGAVARLAVPAIADGCAIDVLGPDGALLEPIAHDAKRAGRQVPAERVAGVIRSSRAELIAHDGSLGLRSAMVVPILVGGVAVGAITLVIADSPRRYDSLDLQIAEELARRAGLAIDNARLYQQARDAIRLRDTFLSVASHELRTPLTAMLLQIEAVIDEAARSGSGDDRRLRRLIQVREQTERLDQLVGHLLDASRISGGKLALEPDDLDLVALVTDIVDGFRASAQRAGSPIGVDVPAAAPGRWDRLRLEQILSNLLSNAIKYGAGSPIDVRVRDRGDRVEVEVSDAGIGIAPEAQTRIFDRFERGASERHYAGLGLGLWIVRELVEAHGGTVAVSSAGSGHGAAFVVTLPRR